MLICPRVLAVRAAEGDLKNIRMYMVSHGDDVIIGSKDDNV